MRRLIVIALAGLVLATGCQAQPSYSGPCPRSVWGERTPEQCQAAVQATATAR